MAWGLSHNIPNLLPCLKDTIMFNNHLPFDFLVDAFFPYVGWYSSSSSSSSEELSAASFNPLRPLTSQIHSHCCFSDSSPWAARGNPHPHPPPRCQLRVRHHVPGRRPPPGHSIVGSCHRMALAPCGVHRRRRTHVVIIIYQFEWPLWGQVNASHHCDNSQSHMLGWIPVQSFHSTGQLKSESEPLADRCNERRYCAAAVARLSVGCYPDVGLQHIELGRGVRGQSCFVTLILLINNMLTILVFSRVHFLLRCVI